MPKYLTALTGLAASLALVATAGAAFAGDITGTITYTGKVPTLKPIAMDADPACKSKHSTPVPSEALVLGAGNTMGNVMVRVKGPVQGSFPVPATPVVIDQKGCQYHPHVLGIRVGQTLQLRNSDGLLHNVHALPKVNTPFNMAMPANRLTADTKFGKEEGMFHGQVRRPRLDDRLRRRLRQPLLLGHRRGRQVHDRGPAAGHLRDRGLAREAGHPDREGDRRRRQARRPPTSRSRRPASDAPE